MRDGDDVRLYTRSGRDVTVSFPELAEALSGQGDTAVVVEVRSSRSRGRLRGLLRFEDPLRHTTHRVRAGDDFFTDICASAGKG